MFSFLEKLNVSSSLKNDYRSFQLNLCIFFSFLSKFFYLILLSQQRFRARKFLVLLIRRGPFLPVITIITSWGAGEEVVTNSPPSPASAANPVFSFPKPRSTSWRDALSSSATSLPRRGTSWPPCSSLPRPRSRSGSRTGATRASGSGRTRA